MRRSLLALSTVVSASVLATSIFVPSASAGVMVGFVLGPTGDSNNASDPEAQVVYDTNNATVYGQSTDSGGLDTSGVAFVTDVTADQITGANAVYGLVFVQDDSPFDAIELAIGRIEVNVSDTSPTLDFSLSGFVNADYSSTFVDGLLVGPDGVLFTSDDVTVTGDRNNPFHYGSLLAFRINLSEAQAASVTEPFEITFQGAARDQFGGPVSGMVSTLTVNPVPEPSGIFVGLAVLSLTALRRQH